MKWEFFFGRCLFHQYVCSSRVRLSALSPPLILLPRLRQLPLWVVMLLMGGIHLCWFLFQWKHLAHR